MSEFWYSLMSMLRKYGYDYEAFSLFGSVHIFWLSLALVSCVLCSVIYRKLSEKGRKGFLVTLSLFILIYEVATQSAYALTDQWTNGVLPLHLCSINIFVCTFYAFFPNKLTGEFLYAVCLPGALFALVVPSWTALPMWNFFHIHSQILHIVLVMFPILLIVGGLRPQIKNLWKIFLIMLCMCAPIYFLNERLRTNFFFISGDDDNALLSALGRIFPDYRIGLLLVVAVVWFIMFMPWELSKKRNVK